MRLNDTYLRSIVYIGRESSQLSGRLDTHGTGFLIEHDGEIYLVTAAHVATDFIHGFMDVRLNKAEDGLGEVEKFESTNWFFHDDTSIDVAAMPFSVPSWAKAKPLKSKSIATDFKVGTKNFGSGDLAYIVGIFNKMRGRERNLPFVHTGHVASMGHGEAVLFDDWRPEARAKRNGNPRAEITVEVKGYFIQATTLPESSGSPVFIRRSIEIRHVRMAEDDDRNARQWVYGSVWLLGLWSGNWRTEDTRNGVILGDDMGLCIPAPRILEVLNKAEVKALREAKKQAATQTREVASQD